MTARLLSRSGLRAVLLAASVCAMTAIASPSAVFAQAVSVIGTNIGLVPPKGMVPSTAFAGFESVDTGASILVSELPPAAYDQILPTFTPAGLGASGLKATGDAIDWKVVGGEGGRLIRGKQTANGQDYRKWVLLAKGPGNTLMVSAQVPESKSSALPDAVIEAALKTVTVRAAPALEQQIAALPFKIGDRVNFRPVQVLGGSGLMLTDGPKDVIPDASQPVVIVASSIGKVAADDKAAREALAKKAFENFAGVSDITITSQSMTEKNGATWSRIEGIGTYRQSLEALSLLQVVRFDGKGGYIRIVAVCNALQRDNVVRRAEILADTVSPK